MIARTSAEDVSPLASLMSSVAKNLYVGQVGNAPKQMQEGPLKAVPTLRDFRETEDHTPAVN